MELRYFCWIFIVLHKCIAAIEYDLDEYFDKTIRNQVDFESIQKTTNYGLVLSYKTFSDQYKEFNKKIVPFIEKLHKDFIEFNYEDLKAYLLDCSTTKVKELCQKSDNYIVLTLFEKDRLFQVEMSPEVEDPNESQYLNMLLQFYRSSWPNFHELYDGKQLKTLIQDEIPKQKWALCYGEPRHVIGKNFCYQVGSIYRKQNEISVGYVATREHLGEVNDYLKLGINVKEVLPMFALWFLNCSSVDEISKCNWTRYLANDLRDNVHLFIKLNYMQSFGKMKKYGTITNIGTVPAPVLFCFHNNATRKEAKAKALDMSEKVRGQAFVVLVNVDFVDETFLKYQMKITLEDYSEFPFYKFWPRSGTESDTQIHQLLDVIDDPVDFVYKFYDNAYDLKMMFETTVTEELMNEMNGSLPVETTAQDDEVELVLHHLKDDRCFNCPMDWKKVTILDNSTVDHWAVSIAPKMVLFWLNVDTMSRAVAEVFSTASTMTSDDTEFGSIGCHDWPEACTRLNVISWPRIVIYKDGKEFGDYKGVIQPDAIANTLILHSQPLMTELSTEDELRKFVEGRYLKLANGQYLPSATLAIMDSNKIPDVFLQAAKSFSGRYFVGWTLNTTAQNWFQEKFGEDKLMPMMITFKTNDPIEPYKFMSSEKGINMAVITNFIQHSTRPKFMNFTQFTYPVLLRNSISMLILLSDNPVKSEFYKIVTNLPECLSDNLQCLLLNHKQERDMTLKILDKWHLAIPTRDTVLYIDIKKGFVYSYRYEAREKVFRQWLDKIETEEEKPVVELDKQSETTERPLMFDYLSLIYGKPLIGRTVVDEEKAKKAEEEAKLLKGPAKGSARLKTEL